MEGEGVTAGGEGGGDATCIIVPPEWVTVVTVRACQPRSRCPGYQLPIPEGEDPFLVYPFGIHLIHRTPWNIESHHGTLRLRAFACKGETSKARAPCQPCAEHRRSTYALYEPCAEAGCPRARSRCPQADVICDRNAAHTHD